MQERKRKELRSEVIVTSFTETQKAQKLIREPKNNIRITKTANKLKLPVARVVAEWMNAPARFWNFKGSIDDNVKRVVAYLVERFPDHDWATLPSQQSFDIVSLSAAITIEVKSVQKGAKFITTNAAIYPSEVYTVDVLPKNFKVRVGRIPRMLDVLVVCVERDGDHVYDYSIVDGNYWGVTTQDYNEVKSLFGNLNNEEFLSEVLDLYTERYKGQAFIQKYQAGMFGAGVNFKLRSRFTMSNPTGNLDVSGWWGV